MRFLYYLSNFLAASLQRFRASIFPTSDWKWKKLRNSTYKAVKSCRCVDVNILNNAFWQYFTKLIAKNLVLLFLIKTVIFKRVLTFQNTIMFCCRRNILGSNMLFLGILSYTMVQTSYRTNGIHELHNIMKYVLSVTV